MAATYLVLHVRKKDVPDHCDYINVEHSVGGWHQEEVDGLRWRPDEPIKLGK